MAHASIMTFNDPNGSIRVKTDNGKVYIYWQVGTYLALSQAEALQVRDDLSRAITEAAHAAIADMQRRGATNVQPHKSRRTDVGA